MGEAAAGAVASPPPPGHQGEGEGASGVPLAAEGPGSDAQAKPTLDEGGTSTAGVAEAPPPYSPPDLKDVYLLYPAFQPNSPVFYQPQPLRPLPNALLGAAPFTIYDQALFGEIPNEADRRRCPPKDYLVESVLVTVFCCFLTGVMALVCSHETRAALIRGDLVRAKTASQKTRSLVLISLFFGVFLSVSWVVYVVVTLYL